MVKITPTSLQKKKHVTFQQEKTIILKITRQEEVSCERKIQEQVTSQGEVSFSE